MHKLFNKAFALACLMALSAPGFAGVTVIVSAHSKVGHLSASQVQALYLGRTQTLPDGDKAALYDLASGSATRGTFYRKATGKSASQVKATWSRLVFSGRAVPPKELGNSAAVVKAVAADPHAVGYVDSGAVTAAVKVVARFP